MRTSLEEILEVLAEAKKESANELEASAKEVAKTYKALYVALLEEGFSETQAMKLVAITVGGNK